MQFQYRSVNFAVLKNRTNFEVILVVRPKKEDQHNNDVNRSSSIGTYQHKRSRYARLRGDWRVDRVSRQISLHYHLFSAHIIRFEVIIWHEISWPMFETGAPLSQAK